MPRMQRTEGQLSAISKHLHYEYQMLGATGFMLALGVSDQAMRNATLESFTIHLRAVLDFLYAETPRPDDVIAEDFMPAGTAWSSARPPITESLKLAKQRTGKEIVHLTYARLDVTPEAKPWSFADLTKEIDTVFRAFIALVPEANLDPVWRKKPAEA